MSDSKSSRPKAILCIHDVSPGEMPAVRRILSDLAAVPVPSVNLALVPAYHQAESWAENPEAAAAIASQRGRFRTEILLHGYYHRRVGSNEELRGRRRFRSRLQSAGEDEFYGLNIDEAEDRIKKGLSVLAGAFGTAPAGFIPPAWALSGELAEILRASGISYTEDHFRLFDLRSGRKMPSPVIAFASRSALRRSLSFAWSRGVFSLAARERVLRVALHPADYRSPKIREFALEMIGRVGSRYDWRLYRDIFSG